jgi:ATP synthase protein I
MDGNPMSSSDASRARGSSVSASGPTPSLWLHILLRCVAGTGAALIVAAAVAFMLHGSGAAASAAFGYAVVALFFGVSLLIGHFVGRSNPSGALGIFVVTYAIKVVGFAAVLFFVGAPQWLDRTWFFGSAVGAVVLWQIIEVAVFAKARHQLYHDDDGAPPSGQRAVDGHA